MIPASPPLPTAFAPAELADPHVLQRQIAQFAAAPDATRLVDAIPDLFVILNEQRQVVYANRALYEALGVREKSAVLGRRVGELLGCGYAATAGGCGLSEFCRTCGAINAMLNSLDGREDTQECSILRHDGNALDLRVRATPLVLDDGMYSAFAIQDISHEKRRLALERIFFHDILNMAGGLRGMAEILLDGPVAERNDFIEDIYDLANQMVRDIRAQQELLAAESGDLKPSVQPDNTQQIVADVVAAYHAHEVAAGRRLTIAPDSEAMEIETDPGLARRVVGNMVKNALEASAPGQTVSIRCFGNGASVAFSVHNEGVMPPEVQARIFQRSFTTKGPGHGLGTYSMRLLTERYLGGQVGFTSSTETGTIFTARLPRSLPTPEPE